jgi:hypothetical protein
MTKIEKARATNPAALSFARLEIVRHEIANPNGGRPQTVDRYRLGKYLPDGRRQGWASTELWKDRDAALHAADLYNGPDVNAVLHS